MYEERYVVGAVGRALRGQVLGYRGYDSPRHGGRRWLMPPDGLVKVVLGFNAPVQVSDPVAPASATVSGVSLADGPRTTVAVGQHEGSVQAVIVLLTPLAAYRISRVPPGEWSQRTADLTELMGRDPKRLAQRLAECGSWPTRFTLLDDILTVRLRTGPEASPQVAWAWEELHRTRGMTRIGSLATTVGWSRRHFERRFAEQSGLPPKAIAQILRLQYAVRLQLSGSRVSEAAARAGYYDQSHYDHTCRAMIGCAPRQLLEHWPNRLDDHADSGRISGVLIE